MVLLPMKIFKMHEIRAHKAPCPRDHQWLILWFAQANQKILVQLKASLQGQVDGYEPLDISLPYLHDLRL